MTKTIYWMNTPITGEVTNNNPNEYNSWNKFCLEKFFNDVLVI